MFAEKLRELVTVDEKYSNILVLLEQIPEDQHADKKETAINNFWTQLTAVAPDEKTLNDVFATLRGAALVSTQTARKLGAAVVGCRPHQKRMRRVFVRVVVQAVVNNFHVFKESRPVILINAATLAGDYYSVCRLSRRQKVLLARSLLRYLHVLLDNKDVRAHRALVSQLRENGAELMTTSPLEMGNLCVSVIRRLVSRPEVWNVWLVLASDLCDSYNNLIRQSFSRCRYTNVVITRRPLQFSP